MADKLTLWNNELRTKCDVEIYESWKLRGGYVLEDVIPFKSQNDLLAKFVREAYDCFRYNVCGQIRLRLETDIFILRGKLGSLFDTWYEPDFSFHSWGDKKFTIEEKRRAAQL